MTTAPAESPVAARPRRPGLFTVARTVAVITLLYALVLVYPPLRLLTLLLPDWSPGTAALLAIIVLPLFGRLAHEWWPGHATRWTSAVALTWLGVCFIAFALLIPLEIALLAGLARRVAGIAIALLGVSLASVPFLGTEFMPKLDEGSLLIETRRLPSTSGRPSRCW